MFEGIEEDVLGDYGLSGGGAAGFESIGPTLIWARRKGR